MELLMDQLDKRREKKQAPGGSNRDTAARGEHATSGYAGAGGETQANRENWPGTGTVAQDLRE
jgi:hypothetical protein